MEYLILLMFILVIVGIYADYKKWDEQCNLETVRKSVQKDSYWQIGHLWIWEGNRK
jgi:hypothetical protein